MCLRQGSLSFNFRTLFIALFLCTSVAAFCRSANAQQDDPPPRSITSDDFKNKRPKGDDDPLKDNRPPAPAPNTKGGNKTGSSKQPPRSKKEVYNHVRRQHHIVRRTKRPTTQKSIPELDKLKSKGGSKVVSQIGITFWKLRPPTEKDDGPRIPVQTKGGGRALWTPERVSPETVFRPGDRVRLAIEAPAKGYLYVIDSEVYSDGSIGKPYMLFPNPVKEDNRIGPGVLVDIPDQTEELPYFLVTPREDKYVGELLTVIVSPIELKSWKLEGKDQEITDIDLLAALEENAPDVDLFLTQSGLGSIFTESEKQALCGSKSRQLTRESSESNPCGPKSRSLTREEPLPQTLYRVTIPQGEAVIIPVRLNVQSK